MSVSLPSSCRTESLVQSQPSSGLGLADSPVCQSAGSAAAADTDSSAADIELPAPVVSDSDPYSQEVDPEAMEDDSYCAQIDEGDVESDPEASDAPLNLLGPTDKVPSPAVASDLDPRYHGYHDIAEIYSPSRTIPIAKPMGLHGLLSLDLCTGWDFRVEQQRTLALELMGRLKVLFCILCPPCRAFSDLQRLWNFRRLPAERVRAILDEGFLYLNHAMAIATAQVRGGRFFAFEHPHRASSWSTAEVQSVAQLPGVHKVTIDLCYFGLVTKVTGTPVRKRTVILTNSWHLLQRLQNCTCCGDHEHALLRGSEGGVSRTAWAQIYPARFCAALAAAAKAHLDDSLSEL